MTEKKKPDEYRHLLAEDGFSVGEGDFVFRGAPDSLTVTESGEGRSPRGGPHDSGLQDSGVNNGGPSGSWLSKVLDSSPGNCFALVLRGAYTKEASLIKGGVRPLLDDMAQMLGSRLAVRDRANAPFHLGVNSAVLLRGEGAVLVSDSWYELRALALVVEKSCIASVAAPLLGGAHPIPFFETLLMRCIYLLKYRKTALRNNKEPVHG